MMKLYKTSSQLSSRQKTRPGNKLSGSTFCEAASAKSKPVMTDKQ